MLVSPTEPKPLRALGTTSLTPEQFGVDFLVPTDTYGAVGIQRKEISDLVASARDGRLSREFSQMKTLGLGVLLIEGHVQWQNGLLRSNRTTWTIQQHRGVIWKAQSLGYWIEHSESLTSTIEFLSSFTKWVSEDTHQTASRRPGANRTVPWGKANNRDWAIHFLQGIDGIGPQMAARIIDHFGGMPVQWTITEMELQQVPGVSASRAAKWIGCLREIT